MTGTPHGTAHGSGASTGQVTTASGVAVDALTHAGPGPDVAAGERPGRSLVWPACGLDTLPGPAARPNTGSGSGSDDEATTVGGRPAFTGQVPPREPLTWWQMVARWWCGPPHEQPDPLPAWLGQLWLDHGPQAPRPRAPGARARAGAVGAVGAVGGGRR